MGTLFAMGAVAFAAAAAVGIFGFVWLLLKLVFLPVRLALGLVKFVVGLIGGLLGMLVMLALAPVLLVVVGGAVVVGLGVAALAVFLPLLPFLLIGLVVWSFLKRPKAAAV